MLKERNNRLYVLFALAAAVVFAGVTLFYTTAMPINKDAGQNTRAAYHLVHAGVVSIDKRENTPNPQIRREPLPIFVTAAFLLLHPAFDQPYTIAELTDGGLSETVKKVNAFWRFLAAIFIFLFCFELFPARRLAAIMAVTCLILSEVFFFARPGQRRIRGMELGATS